ncbi:MAG: sugar phosphate isomerase/epimerase [Anaerosporomusa subterranea]|jgi:sugar phosphate isomerase/epimerase|nr:sugar phosphate isomerase/epimerase [Anaerosporomusa subterranea]
MNKISATIPLQFDTGFSPFFAAEFDEALSWLAENRFDGIEICVSDPKRVNVEELNNKLRRHHLVVTAISTGQSRALEGISLTDSIREVRESAVQRLREHVDLAAAIGFPLVTIGLLRGAGNPGTKDRDLTYLAEALEVCAAYAGCRQVELMIEPINRYETTLLNTVDETVAFLASVVGGEQIGILFDTFHANIEEADICHSLEKLGDRLLHLHFADSNRWLPGMGHIDFSQICATLRKMNYGGYVSLETINMPDRMVVRSRSQTSLKQCFAGMKEGGL